MFDRLWKKIREARGFTIASVVMSFVLNHSARGDSVSGNELLVAGLIVGSSMLAVSFHFTSSGNAAFSVAIPMNDGVMYK